MSTAARAETFGYGQALASETISLTPPAHVRRLIDELFAREAAETASPVHTLTASQISPMALKLLNEFTAAVAGTPGSTVLSIHECSSCFVDGAPGNLIRTSSGTQCLKCDS
jgi:hypothetical protein